MRVDYHFEGFIDGAASPPGAYFYLQFEMPPDATRAGVSYHYEGARPGDPGPKNVLDIAIFDQRGADLLTGGFRGYSGSDRTQFYIAEGAATPGYLAGPLVAGEWQVMLGVAELLPGGARWWLSVEIDVDGGETMLRQPQLSISHRAPRGTGGRWLRGDLHSHSEHSDGANSVEELAAYARGLGLDYLAVTDHNTISHHPHVARLTSPGFLLIPGEEVTTYYGHANVWGLRDWVDFRCAGDDDLRRVVDWVHERGKMFSVNHPKAGGPDWRFRESAFDCLEVWQAPWRWRNEQSLALWSRLLAEGRRLPAVGGSDIHSVPPAAPQSPHGPGNPTTWAWVKGPASEEAVLAAIRAGHAVISEGPAGPFVDLRIGDAMPGDVTDVQPGRLMLTASVLGAEGSLLRILCNEREVWSRRYEVESVREEIEITVEKDGPLRAELWGPRGNPDRGEVVRALTNPIYLRVT